MRYYLLRRGCEFVVYRVRYDLIMEFLEKYQHQVWYEADNLMNLLIVFEQELLFTLEYTSKGHKIAASEK
jgi:hypothetical protein